jgi:predicted TIM-barrel fold metal-dependent hydrolase
VFGPVERFPYDPDRRYTPGDASIADLQRLHRILGIDRVVIVHPSPYGTDNACSLDAARKIGAAARVVAVIDTTETDADLEAMHADGVRGVRVNLETGHIIDPVAAWRDLEAAATRVQPLGWHVQTFTNLSMIAALKDRLAGLPTPIVIDHFGSAQAALGIGQPGFSDLLALIRSGKAYVKLSAGYRISKEAGWSDIAPVAKALIAANPERVVWGTDWPHPGGRKRTTDNMQSIEPFQPIDDGAALNGLASWCDGDAALLKRILVDNPSRLYDYPAVS